VGQLLHFKYENTGLGALIEALKYGNNLLQCKKNRVTQADSES
jgi:hypothetical protein